MHLAEIIHANEQVHHSLVGRKPKPPSERRDQLFAVKLTSAEKRLLDDSDAKCGRETYCYGAPKGVQNKERKAGDSNPPALAGPSGGL
jgi:hypothetical protein